MPQFTIDARGRIDTASNLLTLAITRGDDIAASTVQTSKITTITELVEWALARAYQTVERATEIQKRVTFTAHQEVDPESDALVWILDSIDDIQSLPDDIGREGMENLPGWSTWTAQEASDWIDANVIDLDSAKLALSNMAKAIVYLRNVGLRM